MSVAIPSYSAILSAMHTTASNWDYLVVTASNAAQAQAYDTQLRLRRELGLLSVVEQVIVVSDPDGKRVGSGGSTLLCLLEVLNRELRSCCASEQQDLCDILKQRRILIVHGGGDSRRLPAYGSCGKIFVPVPGQSDSCLEKTLFDEQLPTYLSLPLPDENIGQVVITSGDVLLRFDPAEVRFAKTGITGLGCYVPPEQAQNFGVFGRGQDDLVRLFLQKPSLKKQQETKLIDHYGRAILDIGVMNLTAKTAILLLEAFGLHTGPEGSLELSGAFNEAMLEHGLDFYREICCGMGYQADPLCYIEAVRQSGSGWEEKILRQLFEVLSKIEFHVKVLPRCDFLDFGSSREIIKSGISLIQQQTGSRHLDSFLNINNDSGDCGRCTGRRAWVEGCRINSALELAGDNVVVGIDVGEPLVVPEGMCLDVIAGQDRSKNTVWFVRCYGVNDLFKDTINEGATFCNIPVLTWLDTVGAKPQDIWSGDTPQQQRSLWDARVFPAVKEHNRYRNWLWMFDPAKADKRLCRAWLEADRYSLCEIAQLSDHQAFYERRSRIRAELIQNSLRKMFRQDSEFSHAELAYILNNTDDCSEWFLQLVYEARCHYDTSENGGINSLIFPRIIHTLGAAMQFVDDRTREKFGRTLAELSHNLTPADHEWLKSIGLELNENTTPDGWSQQARKAAFESFGRTIYSSGIEKTQVPHNALKSDEIVWGRVPARLDVGGGWTDTPPYCLEHGGNVVNAAVDLNGQAPIQAYARVVREPVIRIGSIDLGLRIEISSLDELLDYRNVEGGFNLAKAALVISGFSPVNANRPLGITLRQMLQEFGGGIELTTLAAIPKGSGLGTSSIMGTVILAVIGRVLGQKLSHRQLFHRVLRLEQALTTGGGWQDQIGGAVAGAKIIRTEPGLVPDARIHYLPGDVLDPRTNGGQTLLYYTGITRLAKNILEEVVGRYLNRDRQAMLTLRQIHDLASQVAEAMSLKDIERFGRLVARAWELNKQLDPNSSNKEVEALLQCVQPYIYGAKLLGAGGGGFLLMICRSADARKKLEEMLNAQPPNDKARFFDFNVNNDGLVVTVS
ncbi:MAG: L-fucokinase [Planctomycetota bacterium]